MNIRIEKVDRAVWNNELKSFLPDELFDFHSHIFRLKDLPASAPKRFGLFKKLPLYGIRKQIEYNNVLFPAKNVSFLVTGWPYPGSNLMRQNDFVYRQTQIFKNCKRLLLISPEMSNDYILEEVEERRAVGFKPYKCFSRRNSENSRITDFLTEKQISIADRYKLVVTLHLSRKAGIADMTNFNDVLRLSDRYPNARWNLAHCGRSFMSAHLEIISHKLLEFKDREIYFDISAVSDTDVFQLLLTEIGASKILYGSDNPVGLLRGKCLGLGYDWLFVTEDRFRFAEMKESFGTIKPTFLLYEQLRSLRTACHRAALLKKDIDNIFFNNSKRLLSATF